VTVVLSEAALRVAWYDIMGGGEAPTYNKGGKVRGCGVAQRGLSAEAWAK
jgi:hypothetical protein